MWVLGALVGGVVGYLAYPGLWIAGAITGAVLGAAVEQRLRVRDVEPERRASAPPASVVLGRLAIRLGRQMGEIDLPR
jgi:hypothetical protein